MYSLIVENQYKQAVELTHNPDYSVVSIDGIDPPDAVINATHNAASDGSEFNSSYIDNRQITITLALEGEVEKNRIKLYKYFKTSKPVRIYFRNGSRNVYIDGHTQNITVGYFEQKQIFQAVVICSKPLFRDAKDIEIDFSIIESLFEFPFSIEAAGVPVSQITAEGDRVIVNNGDVETGGVITLQISGDVEDPMLYDPESGAYFKLNDSYGAGDTITINSRKGEKGVFLTHQGTKTNIIGDLAPGSTWPVFVPGDNVLSITATTGETAIRASVVIAELFEGV